MLEIIYKNIDDLIPYVNNTRTHSEEQVNQIASSIKEFGFTNPVLIDEQGGLIAGHGRVMGAKKLGLKEVPTITLNNLTEAQKKAYIIADNKLALNAGWDEELLKLEIEALQDMDFNIDLLGFSDEELADLEIGLEDLPELDTDKADEVPEVEDMPCIKFTDVIELGQDYQHRLLVGDSTDESMINILMNGKKIDLIYTDPPYGINEKGDRKGRGNENKSDTKIMAKGGNYKDFKDDTIDYAVKALEITEKLNIPRQIWWGANYYAHAIPQTNNWIIWDKRVEEKYSNTNGDCEMAYVKSQWSSIRIFRHLWMGLIKGSEQGQARVHPTQKPVALAEWCFDYYKADFKNVMDLFTGSGTTLIACENKNKNAFCMEFEPHYAQVIVQRYVDYTSNPKIKINGVEVDWYEYKENKKGE